MRRSELLSLSGLSAKQFDNFSLRGQLPFSLPAAKGCWAEYSEEHVALLRDMTALMKAGLTVGKAREVAMSGEVASGRVLEALQACLGG